MKNKKLNLNELKVKSFVTDLENDKEETVRGGGNYNTFLHCPNTQNGGCTFDACLSLGRGCSDYQVC